MSYRFALALTLGIIIAVSASFAGANEYYFRFTIDSPAELVKLTNFVSIDNVKGDTVFAYANESQFGDFRSLGYDYIILPSPGSLYTPIMTDNNDLVLEWTYYPTYQAYLDIMTGFATTYPGLCQVLNIGYSVEGRQILFAKLSANVGIEENEPEIMYSSTMHGDETTGYILMLDLIEYLLMNYGTDPQVTNILDNAEIWINPLANPDGTYAGGNNTVYGATRGNSNGIDLNRNFPDPNVGPHPDGNDWQAETIAMVNFFGRHNFVISANFHGGVEVVNYPWDTWSRRHADNNWFIAISREYADSAQANSPSGYMTFLNNGITNGWDWYPVHGGRQDCLNYWYGCRENTIELSDVKLLPESQLDDHWDYNRAALLTYIEQAFYGIRGLVTDAQTGQPIPATISVLNHDQDSSEVYTDPDVGDYHRMIEPGSYSLRFISLGYVPQTVNNVPVTSRNITYLDVQLQPLSNDPILEFGNHDAGIVDAGETVSMAITLVNIGGGDAVGVDGVLSTMDSYINIVQDSSSFPTIAALGGTGTSFSDYIFDVSSSCPIGHSALFRLDVTENSGYTDSIFFTIAIGLQIEDFETGDFNSFDWRMSGNAFWNIVTADTYEGTYSAQSGDIGNYQNSTLYIDYEAADNDSISFYYKVSSESGYDFLNFYIDTDLMDQWSGSVDWSYAVYNVAPGLHTFKWEYDKDQSVSHGSDCAWLDFIIFPSASQSLQIVTESLPDWTTGYPYSQQLEAEGGTGLRTWSDLDNDLEGTGLSLSISGLVNGTPLSPGTISFTAHVQDEAGGYDNRQYQFDINPEPVITSDSLPDWTAGWPYSQQLESTGGTGNLTWSDLNGDLAAFGLTVSDAGLVVGLPDTAGQVNFTARVVDDVGAYDDFVYEFTINESIRIAGDTLPEAIIDQPYTCQLEASGGTGILSWSDRDNDFDGTGLVLSSQGLISGTPVIGFPISFVAVATDEIGAFDEQTLVINIVTSFIPGDANGDGRVIGSDVTYLVQYFAGNNPQPDPYYSGDANGDCQVIGSDVTYLVNYFRGAGPPPIMGDCPPVPSGEFQNKLLPR